MPCTEPYPILVPRNGTAKNCFCETNSGYAHPQRSAKQSEYIAATGGENGKAFALRHRETYWRMKSLHMPPPITCLRHRLCRRRQLETACCPVFQPLLCLGTPLHTWQLVSQGRTSIAHKECCWRRKLWQQPHLISSLIRAIARMPTRASASYGHATVYCPIPKNVTPSPLK